MRAHGSPERPSHVTPVGPLFCVALPVVSRNGPPHLRGTGRANLAAHEGEYQMTNYDRNIPTDSPKKQWTWFAMTVAFIALAVVLAVL